MLQPSAADDSSCSFTASVNSKSVTALLDTCAIEGIVGGTSPSAAGGTQALPQDACSKDSDCSAAGSICNTADFSYQSCSCANGIDTCVAKGRCSNFCDAQSTKDQLQALNRLVGCSGRGLMHACV